MIEVLVVLLQYTLAAHVWRRQQQDTLAAHVWRMQQQDTLAAQAEQQTHKLRNLGLSAPWS